MKIRILSILFLVTLIALALTHGVEHTDKLRVSFLDVGQGDAIFIQSPSGVEMLIDGGVTKKVLEEVSKKMSPFDNTISFVVATHPDLDHIGGLTDVVQRFNVNTFIHPQVEHNAEVQNILFERIQEKNIQTHIARRGDVYDLGSGVRVTVLFPYGDVTDVESNSASIVVKVDYGNTSFLLTGDAPVETEYILAGIDKEKLKADVLKLGHHGSDTSTSETFLAFVQPEYSVVSAGKDNTYGHPHADVIERVRKFKSRVYDTRLHGTITFVSDGERIEVFPDFSVPDAE